MSVEKLLNENNEAVSALEQRGVEFTQLFELGQANANALSIVLREPDCDWAKKHSNEQKAFTQGAVSGMFDSLDDTIKTSTGALRLPPELGKIIGEYLTPDDGINVSMVNKSAVNTAKEEQTTFAEKYCEKKTIPKQKDKFLRF